MSRLRHLTLRLLLLCCCDIPAPGYRGWWTAGVRADDDRFQTAYSVTVNLSSSHHDVGSRYLSVAFPAKYTPHPWTDKLINLASALSPADIRVLGKIDLFCPGQNVDKSGIKKPLTSGSDHDDPCKSRAKDLEFVLTGNHWQIFNANVAKVGWNLLLGFENRKRKSDGSWESSLAEQLVNYSSTRGIPIHYFHLGNEPNLYPVNAGVTVTAKTLVDDYKTLKRLLSKYPLYADSRLYGPDVTNLDKHATARNYLTQFLAAGGGNVVDGISLHHYYCKSDASAETFLNPMSLDSLRTLLQVGKQLVPAKPMALPILLSETSSCSGGGTPGLSDRYLAGFLWLDKLGLSALYGIKQLFRQSFYSGASYSLVLTKNATPQPDYFLSVLFKRLVEGPVFEAHVNPPSQKLRVYANCARNGRYLPGALVIYYVNLEETQVVLSLTQFKNAGLDLYMLTPGDSDGLKSRDVKLNGQTLQMSGSELPPLLPKRHSGDVKVEAQTFGFIVVPDAHIRLCVQYFSKK